MPFLLSNLDSLHNPLFDTAECTKRLACSIEQEVNEFGVNIEHECGTMQLEIQPDT